MYYVENLYLACKMGENHKGAFKYYVSAFGRVGGLIKNADTADAWEGGGGFSDEMLTLLILGSGGMEKSWLRAEIKRK